jgi:cell division protein FtsL
MNKFIKNLSTVNIVLLVVLGCICLIFLSTVINSKYKKYKTNNSVEQTINRIKGIREGFETNDFNKANMNSGKQAEELIDIAAEKAAKEKEEQEKLEKEQDGVEDPESGDLADSDEGGELGELDGNEGSSLDDMFTNLKTLEKKCKDYEDSQEKNDLDDKRKHEELIQEQLDIENVKINELTQIVNFYRKKYTEKKSVTGQCRKQKFGELEKTMKDVVELSNQHNNSASKHEVNVKLPSN